MSAQLWQYPSGAATVANLQITFGDRNDSGERQKIGSVPIDTAMMVVGDQSALKQHWTEVGPDRIGVIVTLHDDNPLAELVKRFHFATERIDPVRVRIQGDVSEAVESEILDYLRSIPRYAKSPSHYFYIQTNNSYDRVRDLGESWGLMPIGDEGGPMMIACSTGRGDGTYDVNGEFVAGKLTAVSIEFISENSDS